MQPSPFDSTTQVDGVIRANTASGITATNGRTCTIIVTEKDHGPRDGLMHDLDLPSDGNRPRGEAEGRSRVAEADPGQPTRMQCGLETGKSISAKATADTLRVACQP
jgi:hypothetical protein